MVPPEKRKKRIVIGLFVVGAIGLAVLAVLAHGPVSEATQSCRLFRTFTDHIQRAQWPEAQALLQTNPEWFRIEDGRVLYLNHDYTDFFASTTPLFWRTLKYYLTDRRMGAKVIFRTGYVQLKDGKITFVKIP